MHANGSALNCSTQSGVYSFFNGFCPFNVIFREVACLVCQLELDELGLDLEYRPLRVAIDEKAWVGVSRRYYVRDTYHLPVATLRVDAAGGAEPAEDAAEDAPQHAGEGP